MARIPPLDSSSNQIADFFSASVKNGSSAAKPSTVSIAPADETRASPLQAQLTRLSSVLSGLQAGANAARAQYVAAYQKVRSGSYTVDPLDVSRSLVQDLLTN